MPAPGTHKGYTITTESRKSGTAVIARVWHPARKRYTEKRSFGSWKFDSVREAERAAVRWAKAKHRRFLAGQEDGRGGRVDTARVLAEYLEDRRSRGGNTGHIATVRRRLRDLHKFMPDMAAQDAPRQAHTWWKVWCEEIGEAGRGKGMPKSERTRNNGLGDLRALVNWAWRYRALTGLEVPVDLDWIQPLRVPQKVRPQFTLEELRACLRCRRPFRVRFALYLYLGARLREALRLRWSDFQGGMVLLRGKGQKERLAPLQPELATILRIYRREHPGFDGDWLFPVSGREDDSGNLAHRFDCHLRAAGVAKAGRSTHSLRHCYAGLMTATGEPTALLKSYMGHSQEKMSEHYAQMAARYRESVEGWERGRLRVLRVKTAVSLVFGGFNTQL